MGKGGRRENGWDKGKVPLVSLIGKGIISQSIYSMGNLGFGSKSTHLANIRCCRPALFDFRTVILFLDEHGPSFLPHH